MTAAASRPSSVDAEEIARFDRLAADWWNPNGPMRPLHQINPVRLGYVREEIARAFRRDAQGLDGLAGLTLLDIGCAAGLLCEPLARLGGQVTGIDASASNIAVATRHAQASKLTIDYRTATAEDLASEGRSYDVVLALEVVEHVADPAAFLATAAALVAPQGLLIVSTINRTLKAYALAIIGAEYILRWLPRGTHRFEKLVRPEEIVRPLAAAGFAEKSRRGLIYHPLQGEWRLSADTDVNYLMSFAPETL